MIEINKKRGEKTNNKQEEKMEQQNKREYKSLFRGVGTELATSYQRDGSVDHSAIRHMVEWQIEKKINYIFVNGISSESYMMTFREQESLAKTMCAASGGRVPVMCNVMVPGYKAAMEMLRRYEAAGAAAVCITPPYLAPYPEAALEEYYSALIESAGLPVYIYNAPQTHNMLSPELLAKLANKYSNLCGYKDSTQSVTHLETAMGLIKKEFDYIAGSDATILTTLALGGCGIISFVTAAFPEPVIELCEAFFAGDLERARERQTFVMKIRDILRKGGNSAGYKYASELVGCPIRGSRYPDSLLVLSPELKKEIHSGLRELSLVP